MRSRMRRRKTADTTGSRRRNVWSEAAAGSRPNALTTPGASLQNLVCFVSINSRIIKKSLDISANPGGGGGGWGGQEDHGYPCSLGVYRF